MVTSAQEDEEAPKASLCESVRFTKMARACRRTELLLSCWNDPEARPDFGLFHSSTSPNISLGGFLYRVVSQINSDGDILVVAWVYLDRFLALTHYAVSELTVHRLFLAVVTVAHLWMEDRCFTNKHISRCGGVSPRELERLVLALCRSLEWRLWVSEKEYERYSMMLSLTE